MAKTNVVRILEQNLIAHEVVEYSFTEEEIDAISVARKINAEAESVFKTLVTRGDKNGINVFVIPGNMTLNLKKAAALSSNKNIEMIKEKELLPLTGYIKGGCSPIGMKKSFPTYIDETALLFDKIFVSAGKRGYQIHLSPNDLAKLTDADFGDLI
ncbi:MAG: Cys-tRNA(Pro) deacylase [Ignavibacteriales bacterium CG_4_9_14_3_um_filter_34_10]|nr:MAG: Cys-tRNA(Pro) deacylase [Ignavibacteriales bacterium CG_4_9_14_3_um_filter_34_10]